MSNVYLHYNGFFVSLILFFFPELESHLVTSSGLDLKEITNKGSSKEAVFEMRLEGNDSQSFISDLSYHSPHKTIYVASMSIFDR